MFIGHFALGLAAKKAAPKASLGMLFLGVQFADLLWPVLVLAGIEQVRIAPGDTKFTPLEFISYPYSHSLAFDLIWGMLLGGIYFLLRREAREAIVVGLCVVSHWVLDYISHRADMPLWPGSAKYGLGLWNSVAWTMIVEGAMFAAGAAIYLTCTRAKDKTGTYATWGLLLFLLVVNFANVSGPPPPSVKAVAIMALAMWLLVAWGWWADRHRERRGEGPGR